MGDLGHSHRQDLLEDQSGGGCWTHLVLRQAAVVRDQQGGPDLQVPQTLHKAPPCLGSCGVVEDLLRRDETLEKIQTRAELGALQGVQTHR